ncbi:MAG: N-acetylmuramic acid 6-phosphate etherase [Pedosphaera sp.]|nr:N-acetylmuramic acid 6-phosphate etherase [Pedosphaera sp.]MSU43576.1 N-acetylmuramic acid 6-phosphate etherase [Pedosphaera sp.]
MAQHFLRPFTLGIEGGGTRTVAVMLDARGRVVRRAEFGPGNVRLLDDAQLRRLLQHIAAAFPKPDAVGLGMAGARTEKDRSRLRQLCARVWRGVGFAVTHDLEIALAANENPNHTADASILVLSGTGSCCFGRARDGRVTKLGGWGHLLGDKGSGYELGLRALKAAVYYLDRDGTWSVLGQRLLAATHCNAPEDWIDWARQATKETVAALAIEVFAAARQRDRIALDVLDGAAAALSKDACACADKLAGATGAAEFLFAGGVFTNQPAFARRVASEIRQCRPASVVRVCRKEGAVGAAIMARSCIASSQQVGAVDAVPLNEDGPMPAQTLPQTELRNPKSRRLDRMSVSAAMKLMLDEDRNVPAAIWAERRKLAALITAVSRALRQGGRLFYVGAGTSGRLGVLDASECPPTFRTAPEQVQGIIAGGPSAVFRAVEGAEDDSAAGAVAVRLRGVCKADVVLGIAASGRTPFVWGALHAAAQAGVHTALLCFDASVKRRAGVPRVIIAPQIGPEILTGSTRLKAGTATKLVLNILTTLAMVQLGKVAGNLMVDLNPKNGKLRDRAVRIVCELARADATQARAALEQSGWIVKTALRRLGWR